MFPQQFGHVTLRDLLFWLQGLCLGLTRANTDRPFSRTFLRRRSQPSPHLPQHVLPYQSDRSRPNVLINQPHDGPAW